jgi:hypothetical protein
VARAATAHRRLMRCEVGGEGTKVVGKVRRARRSEAGLTQIARASVGQWGGAHVMAGDGSEAGSVVTDDGALALHHRGRGEWGSRMTGEGRG